MTLGKRLKADFQEIEQRFGIAAAIVDGHAETVLVIMKAIDVAAKNPVVAGVLAAVVPPSLMAHYPQIVDALDKAIVTVTAGAALAEQIAAAPTTEAKLIIVIQSLQASNPIMHSLLLRGICEELLSILDNKALSAEVYAYYLQAKALLN